MNEELRKITQQNEVIIPLLAKIAFTKEEIRGLVTHKKRKPENYIEGYNCCDGSHSVSDLARIIGVKQWTLSPILIEWEQLGIVREVDKPKGKFYKKLFSI